MKISAQVMIMLMLITLLGGFTPGKHRKLIQLKGAVLSEKTGQPVNGALIYVILGEEEALSKGKGTFVLETSRELPVQVITEHPSYLKHVVELRSVSQPLVIRLKPRQK